MCGIAGVVNLQGRLSPDRLERLALAMANSLRHRGPDDQGLWLEESNYCAFSHRRLSIIDTSTAGHQPMVLPDGATLTFNGELYNYKSLRNQLEMKGIRFVSESDSEVLLRGLNLHGLDFVHQLDGMYAFAFFEPKSREVWLARDNFGEKPLYYSFQNGLFCFASELHALTLQDNFDASVGIEAIATYLALQYLPAPQTIYRAASKLPPGHVAILKPDGNLGIRRHFHFQASPAYRSERSLDDLADELENVLIDTVRTRMISDVPLGAFLSGGVDSSTVVAIASQKLGKRIQTFSMGFKTSKKSEHEMACDTANHLGADHHNFMVDFDAVAMGKEIGAVLDEPNGDNSTLPTFLLAQHAKCFVTVALSGDGGDEMFGGYTRYFDMLREETQAMQNGSTSWLAGDAYYADRILIMSERVLKLFLGNIPEQTTAWLSERKFAINEDKRPLINKMREADTHDYLPGAVLSKVDRMTMRHALEIRSPLLGRAVAEFAGNLAADVCYAEGQGKLVLKRVAERFLPREWLQRPKLGFSLALEDWDSLTLAMETRKLLLASDCCLQRWIPMKRLESFCNFHSAKPVAHHLWSVFILETWLRHHPATPAI